ncbi:MAG: chorismate mutase [Tissierellia bacterium]|nr:chorismate mutase [Tissierellia bacterium]MDD4726426.1 chorismate mutase [Tissierellia bacterium]
MEDLNYFRDRLDKIDEQLICLFEERMEISIKIGQYKEKNNLPIFDEKREKLVIEKGKSRLNNKTLEELLEKFLIHLMNLSKDVQK